MGKIIELEIDKLKPIQPGLREYNVIHLARSYFNNPMKTLIPVRENSGKNEEYTLLDGHHSSCFVDFINEYFNTKISLYGWVAKSNNDFIDFSQLDSSFHQEGIRGRIKNMNIESLYNHSMKDVPENFRVNSIREIRDKYHYFNSIDSFFDYVYPGFSDNYKADLVEKLGPRSS